MGSSSERYKLLVCVCCFSQGNSSSPSSPVSPPTPSPTPSPGPFSHHGIVALGKPHTPSAPSLNPRVGFKVGPLEYTMASLRSESPIRPPSHLPVPEWVSKLVLLNTVCFRPGRVGRRPLPYFLAQVSAVTLCSVLDQKLLKPLSTSALPSCRSASSSSLPGGWG